MDGLLWSNLYFYRSRHVLVVESVSVMDVRCAR